MSLYFAAIDFGTTFTGLAFLSTATGEMELQLKWPGGPTGCEVKAPTVALFNSRRQFMSFGFQAKKDFLAMSDTEKKTCYYFEKFKMELHNKDRFNIYDLLNTSNNKKERKLPIITVFTAAVQYLKDQLLELLAQANPKAKYECDDIQWIITVPAIWKSGARQLMREAAIKAGLLEKDNPRKLIIALEPEAAAVFIKKDKLCDFKHYMVVDCGGGTVDICVHEVVRGIDGQDVIREKSLPSGGDWGGIYVDKNFIEFLEKIFLPKCINKVKDEELHGWQKLIDAFQEAKRNFICTTPVEIDKDIPDTNSELEGIEINIDVVDKIEEFYKGEKFREILKKRSSAYDGKAVMYKHGQLQITKETMKSLFAPVIKKILRHLQNLLKTESGCYGVEAIFLVGGFSESPLLQESIKKAFEPEIKIVVPFGPQLAIVKGAVLYGMQPRIITERVASFTYGIEVCNNFDPSKHDKKYLFKNKEGIDMCDHLFKLLVEKNTIITPDKHEYPIELGLVDEDQTDGVVNLYTTENPNITYITDQGAQMKGRVSHKIPNPEKGYSRKLKVVLDFSGTEIYLIVTDTESDVITYTTVDFLHDQY